ncbi:hypothetical protein R77567_01624 [Ralstonia sp. LMG 32965]|uniref:Uncharacterized protein n=2 Tax=Ralstonia flatus TaxID=3058601 RepID=A0AAD2F449_9RALS|nr:hypothetical protein R77567_01624 [Ralstonia sp. LMG 32965]
MVSIHMAGITLQQAQAQLDAWIAANTAVAAGQSYSIGGRSLTRVNAAEILNQIEFWERRVVRLSNGRGGIRVRYAQSNGQGQQGGQGSPSNSGIPW